MKYEECTKEMTRLFQEIKLEIVRLRNENEDLKEELQMYKSMYNTLSEAVYNDKPKKR